jgi:hypothetical protein
MFLNPHYFNGFYLSKLLVWEQVIVINVSFGLLGRFGGEIFESVVLSSISIIIAPSQSLKKANKS